MNRLSTLFIVCTVAWALGACTTSRQIAMEPATISFHDVFTCKGLDSNNRWVGVTDVFLPDQDSRVVVVARLDPSDQEKTVYYELVNPENMVAFSERRRYPKEEVLGIYFGMHQIMERGGEGKWKALVTSDGMPVGRAEFYVGEKPEAAVEDSGFFVIGEGALESEEDLPAFESPESRYSGYIQEVTPADTPSP